MILPVLGTFVDRYGDIGYARGFVVVSILSASCVAIAIALKWLLSRSAAEEARLARA